MSLCSRSSTVTSLRLQTPYIAFPPRLVAPRDRTHTQGQPPSTSHTHPESRQQGQTFRPSNSGYGSRHFADLAPFTLWDTESGDFQHPTPQQNQWILEHFNAVSVTYTWPRIIIETPIPPLPVPLTVACVAAVFVPVGSRPRHLTTRTGYSNPRLPDPIPPHMHLPKWGRPSSEQCQFVIERLAWNMNINAISFISPIIVVELCDQDGKKYERRSLPGIVGGRTTIYHHSDMPFWGMAEQARERLINPLDAVQDTTNYLNSDARTMCPGVRVESGPVSKHGEYWTATMASSAGVLLRSVDEGPRLTVFNHGFLGTDEVYHPSSQAAGVCIGQITERFEHLDIALVRLSPSSSFTNSEYFQAQTPTRLLRSNQVSENVWCSLDGMATGLVFLRLVGVRMRRAQRPPGVVISFAEFLVENIMEFIGPAGGRVRDGVCGAPIVVDDGQDGGVVGFFQLGAQDSDWALSPCLDDLLDRDWALV